MSLPSKFTVYDMEYTTNQKGLITEMEVALYLIKLGYNVSQPLNVDSKYDFIVDTGKQLIRLQVKTSHLNKHETGFEFKCRSITVNSNKINCHYYSSDDVDYFATYWNGEVYLIPVNQCSAVKNLYFDKHARKGVCWYEDYKASEVLKTL